MLLLIQECMLTLLTEVAGVACTAGILYLYWNTMTKNKSKEYHTVQIYPSFFSVLTDQITAISFPQNVYCKSINKKGRDQNLCLF